MVKRTAGFALGLKRNGKSRDRRSKAVYVAALAATGLVSSLSRTASAATDIWTGASSTDWNSTAGSPNWTGNNPPATGDSFSFTGADPSGTTLTDTLASSFIVDNVTYSGGVAYTMTGNAFVLGTGTSATVLTNGSSVTQIINNNITFGNATQTIALTSGGLTLGGTVSSGGTSTKLTLSGGFALNVNNTFSLGTNVANVLTTANTAGESVAIGNGVTMGVGLLAGGGSTGGSITFGNSSSILNDTGGTGTSFDGPLSGAGVINVLAQQYFYQTNTGATNTNFSGTLDIEGGDNRFGKGGASLGSGVLELNSTAATSSANTGLYINGTGTFPSNINVVGNGGYIRANGGTTSISGSVEGSGTFILLPSDAIVSGNWTSSNAFTSAFAGTVQIGSNGGSQTGAPTVLISSANSTSSSAAYNIVDTTTANSTLSADISGGGILNLGALTSTNANSTYKGIVTNNLANTSTVSIGNLNTNTTFTGVVQNGSGTIALTKVGTGSLELTGASTYTGMTTLSAGTLQAGVSSVAGTSGAFGNGGPMTVNGGTLDLNGFNEQVGSLSGSGGIITNGNATASTPSGLTVNDTVTGTSTYGGTIQNGSTNTLGLTLASTNVAALDLTGTSTYTGATLLNGGSLQVGGGAGSLSGSALTMAANTTLILGDSNGTGGAAFSGLSNTGSSTAIIGGNSSVSSLTVNYANTAAGQSYAGTIGSAAGNGNLVNLTKGGAGQWNLTGNSTYTGTTTISAGGLGLLGGTLGNTAVTVGHGSTAAYLTATGNGSTTGTIGGSVSVSANAAIDFTKDGATSTAQTLRVGSLTLTTATSPTAATVASLSYNLTGSGAGASTDTITTSGALTVGSGQAIVDLSGTATSGVYVLASYASQSGQAAPGTTGTGFATGPGGTLGTGATNTGTTSGAFVLGTIPTGLITLTLDDTATQLLLQVSATATPTSAYWSGAYANSSLGGASNNWGAFNSSPVVTNWSNASGTTDTGQVPGSSTDVVFSALQSGNGSNGTTGASLAGTTINANLAQSFTINSLTVNSTPAAVNVTGTGTLTLNAAASTTGGQGYAAGTGINILSGAGSLTISTSGAVVAAANQTWTNGSSNVFTVSSPVSGNATLGNVTTLTLSNNGSGNTVLGGVISDGGAGQLALAVSSSGSGVTQLTNVGNTFTGGTTVTGGTLQLTAPSGGSTGELGPISTTVTVNGGVLDLNDNSQTIGNLNGSGGTVLDNGTASPTLTIGGGNATGGNYAGTIANSNNAGISILNLAKTGTGTSVLSGANTFTGTTAIGAGALNLQNASALADSSAVTVAGGAALQIQGGITLTTASLTLNGAGLSAGANGALESVSGANSFASNITLGTAAAIGVDANTFSVSSPISGAVGLILNGSGGDGTLSSTLSTITALTKSGLSTWQVSGPNTYSGATTLASGTLQAGIPTNGTISGPFGGQNNAFTENGGTLDIDGNNVGVGTFSSTAGTIADNGAAATLTVGNNNGAVNLNGLTSVSGALTINVTGTGAWTQNPVFSSTVTSAGGLSFTNAGTAVPDRLNSLPTNLGTNGVLTLNGGGNIQNTVGITLGAGNAIVVNGSGNSWNAQQNSTGTALTTNGPWTGSGTVTLTNGFAIPTATFGGNMTGFAGTFIADWNSSGAVSFSNSANIGLGSSVLDLQTGSTGETVQYTGGGNVTFPIGDLNTTGNTGAGAITLLNATASSTVTWQVGTLNASSTYAGQILNGSGTSALTKTGSGVWTLTNTSTYTGTTLVNGGTLNVTGALANSGTIIVDATNASTNLVLNGAGALSSSAPITAIGPNAFIPTITVNNSQNLASITSVGTTSFTTNTSTVGSMAGTGTLLVGSLATLNVTSSLNQSAIVSAGSINVSGGASNIIGQGNGVGTGTGTTGFTSGGITGTGTLTVNGTANLYAAAISQNLLNIGSTNTVTIADSSAPGNTAATSVLTDINNSGTLDLKNNDLIVLDTTQYTAVKALISNAADGGAWDQAGITSSSARANSAYGLGYAQASTIGSTSFDGQTFTDAVLVKYTLLGDTQLRGAVGIGDYDTVLNNFGTGTDWYQGNFHYSGTVGIGDYDAVLNNFGVPIGGNVTVGNALARGLSPAFSINPNFAKADLKLEVNTVTGDVYALATTSVGFAGYTVADPSAHLIVGGSPDTAKLLSVAAQSGGNTNVYETAGTYVNWNKITEVASQIAEGQNNNGYANHSSRDDTINIPSGGTIDFGDIYNTTGGVQDITFNFAEANTTPTNGPAYYGAEVDYISSAATTPEPATLGILGLGGVMMMRRQRRTK